MSKPKLKKERFWCPNYGPMPDLSKDYQGKYYRCPKCSKRVMPRAVIRYSFEEAEFTGYWQLPMHKTKPRTKEIV